MKWLGFLVFTGFSFTAYAYDFYVEGNYSLEGNYLSSVDLGNTDDGSKEYFNQHIFVKPEFIFFEGLSFHGALDILNGAGSLPPSNRVGYLLGGNLEAGSREPQPDMPTALLDRQLQKSRWINLNEAYLKYSHTNGELKVGRKPLEFGYGAFYSAGNKVFDHWFTNRDGISYSFSFGSLSFEPMVGILSDPMSEGGTSVFEYGLKFGFSVEETGLDLGAMILYRQVPASENGSNFYGEAGTSAKPEMYSVFYNRKLKKHRFGFETLFQGGDIGKDSSGNSLSLKGFGFAGEYEYLGSKHLKLSAKLGYASGDDTTDSAVSSVTFNRNYNLGFILFNHPLGDGSYDLLGTDGRGRRGSLTDSEFRADRVADTDSISNALYFAPTVGYDFSKSWYLGSTLVTAFLDEKPDGVSSYLGSELDITLNYRPTENIIYTTTLGYFMSGSAFDISGFSNKNAFGITTGLGINF